MTTDICQTEFDVFNTSLQSSRAPVFGAKSVLILSYSQQLCNNDGFSNCSVSACSTTCSQKNSNATERRFETLCLPQKNLFSGKCPREIHHRNLAGKCSGVSEDVMDRGEVRDGAQLIKSSVEEAETMESDEVNDSENCASYDCTNIRNNMNNLRVSGETCSSLSNSSVFTYTFGVCGALAVLFSAFKKIFLNRCSMYRCRLATFNGFAGKIMESFNLYRSIFMHSICLFHNLFTGSCVPIRTFAHLQKYISRRLFFRRHEVLSLSQYRRIYPFSSTHKLEANLIQSMAHRTKKDQVINVSQNVPLKSLLSPSDDTLLQSNSSSFCKHQSTDSTERISDCSSISIQSTFRCIIHWRDCFLTRMITMLYSLFFVFIKSDSRSNLIGQSFSLNGKWLFIRITEPFKRIRRFYIKVRVSMEFLSSKFRLYVTFLFRLFSLHQLKALLEHYFFEEECLHEEDVFMSEESVDGYSQNLSNIADDVSERRASICARNEKAKAPLNLFKPSFPSACMTRSKVVFFLLFFLVSASQPSAAGSDDAKRLYDDLLSNYNKLVRPVGNVTDVLTVRIKLKLSQLIDVVSTFLFLLM